MRTEALNNKYVFGAPIQGSRLVLDLADMHQVYFANLDIPNIRNKQYIYFLFVTIFDSEMHTVVCASTLRCRPVGRLF